MRTAYKKKKLELPQVEGYTFDKENHVHALNGKALTGVTTVLSVIAKPALIQWAANMACDFLEKYLSEYEWDKASGEEKERVIKEARTAHRKKKESAGDHGTEVHAHIESVINLAIDTNEGFITGNFDNQSKSVLQFVKWAQDNKVKFLASEKNIYSESWWVGGIADIVCEIDGKRYIGDIKTSSDIYPEHFVQACAYAKMAKEMGLYQDIYRNHVMTDIEKPAFDGVIIINLDKKGGFKTKTFYNIQQGIEVFESALNIYRFKESVTI